MGCLFCLIRPIKHFLFRSPLFVSFIYNPENGEVISESQGMFAYTKQRWFGVLHHHLPRWNSGQLNLNMADARLWYPKIAISSLDDCWIKMREPAEAMKMSEEWVTHQDLDMRSALGAAFTDVNDQKRVQMNTSSPPILLAPFLTPSNYYKWILCTPETKLQWKQWITKEKRHWETMASVFWNSQGVT